MKKTIQYRSIRLQFFASLGSFAHHIKKKENTQKKKSLHNFKYFELNIFDYSLFNLRNNYKNRYSKVKVYTYKIYIRKIFLNDFLNKQTNKTSSKNIPYFQIQ